MFFLVFLGGWAAFVVVPALVLWGAFVTVVACFVHRALGQPAADDRPPASTRDTRF